MTKSKIMESRMIDVFHMYPTMEPSYTLEDFHGDDLFDFLCYEEDEDTWETVSDNSSALREPYYFTMYIWFYYDFENDEEKLLEEFYDDFLAYSFSDDNILLERELRDIALDYDIIEPYSRYRKLKMEYLKKGENKGNAASWEDLCKTIGNILLSLRWQRDIEIYRVIAPKRTNDKSEHIDMSKIGNCWSLNLSDAMRFSGEAYNHVKDGHPFLILGTTPTLNIDWVTSALLKFKFPKEAELRVFRPENVYVDRVYDLDDENVKFEWKGSTEVVTKDSPYVYPNM